MSGVTESPAPHLPTTVDHDGLAGLRERGLLATDLSFTLTDPYAEDAPLVWVNPAFTRMTGYGAEESVGRNCRFLQGPATDPAAVQQLRDGIAAVRPVTETLLNYRRDGSTFWNQVSISPVFDRDDNLVSFVGVQSDVTDRVQADIDRQAAHDAERRARHDAEGARLRLGLLAEATIQLASTLDVEEALERLAALIVPTMADWVSIQLVDEQGAFDRIISLHRDGMVDLMGRRDELFLAMSPRTSETHRVLDDGEPILIADVGEMDRSRSSASEELKEVARQLGLRSVMYVPLLARRRILGAITFVSGSSGRLFDRGDLSVAADLGRRAGLTFDNARLYEHEHGVAETLQRSLLPVLPAVEGLEVAARYLPGDVHADVGGDFYEILPLPDGSIGFAVGDVTGHDLLAAAAMGHLRGLLRACAWNNAEGGHPDPASVLDQVDRLMQGLDMVTLATMLFGRLERPETAAGPWRLTYANAGHPPPMVRHADGAVELLDAVHGILLGVSPQSARRSASVELEAGATLVAFTDGLVERRNDSIDNGFARLVEVLRRSEPIPERIVDGLIATLGEERSDDTAVLCVHVAVAPAQVDAV